jgi:APA family basic amino acid/polyamine antiporter
MANDGLLFRWAGAVHPRFQTPHRAIVLQALWASALVALSSFRGLFLQVVYTEWIFFGLMALGLFALRRRPGLRRDYPVWGYPLMPAIFAAAAFTVVANRIYADPLHTLEGLALVLLGLPVYFLWARHGPVPKAAS